MKKPQVKIGRVYPWHELVKKGDFFVIPTADVKKAQSIRINAKARGLSVKVLPLVEGGYMCELREDTEEYVQEKLRELEYIKTKRNMNG